MPEPAPRRLGWLLLGYLGAVELCGLRGARLTVVAMQPGRGAAWTETRAVRLEAGSSPTRAVTAQGTLALGDRAGRIAVDLAGLSVDLELTLHDAGPLPGLSIEGGRARGELAWRPLALRACATGRIVRAGERTELVRSPAYVDHVRSTIAPRAVPVRVMPSAPRRKPINMMPRISRMPTLTIISIRVKPRRELRIANCELRIEEAPNS